MKTIQRRSTYAINYSFRLFGDKWMPLFLWDLRFNKKKSFQTFQVSDEKKSSAVLTEKLNTPLNEGIVSKVTAPQNAAKFLYLLVDKGIELEPFMG